MNQKIQGLNIKARSCTGTKKQKKHSVWILRFYRKVTIFEKLRDQNQKHMSSIIMDAVAFESSFKN